MTPRRLLFAGVVAAALLPRAATAAELTVEVVGLRSAAGRVHFGLYDDPAMFPKDEGRRAGANVAIEGRRAVARFAGLMPGRYAVAVYHDENGNGAFDQGIFGLPLEDYGFSNDAPVFFAPPSFEDAAFELPEAGARIVIRLD